jgi:hypothetical protein
VNRAWPVLVLIAALLAPAPRAARADPPAPRADPPAPRKPLIAEVFLRKYPAARITGTVVRSDDDGVVLRTAGGEKIYRWLDLTPGGAFALRAQLIDRNSPAQWLKLGEMAWKTGLEDRARRAFDNATKLDPILADDVQAILATKPGSAAFTATTQAAGGAATLYRKSTPEEDAAAIARARRVAADVQVQLKLKFTEFQTPHFIVFTDWDPREFDFIRSNLEGAYGAVARQFAVSPKDNVFVGKLPVFMFAKRADFARYAQTYDDVPEGLDVAGYYAGGRDGAGHMAMWKPTADPRDSHLPSANMYPPNAPPPPPGQARGNAPPLPANGGGSGPAQLAAAQREWAYTLTHEFTHAFIDRYRSSRTIPRWLNEGIAEVVAQSQFPRPERRAFARTFAAANNPVDMVFHDDEFPGGEYYPVMQSMVEMLISRDRQGFLKFVEAIKNGEKAEAALKRIYGVDYGTMPRAWRDYVMH